MHISFDMDFNTFVENDDRTNAGTLHRSCQSLGGGQTHKSSKKYRIANNIK